MPAYKLYDMLQRQNSDREGPATRTATLLEEGTVRDHCPGNSSLHDATARPHETLYFSVSIFSILDLLHGALSVQIKMSHFSQCDCSGRHASYRRTIKPCRVEFNDSIPDQAMQATPASPLKEKESRIENLRGSFHLTSRQPIATMIIETCCRRYNSVIRATALSNHSTQQTGIVHRPLHMQRISPFLLRSETPPAGRQP